ncbi:hypothetical protein DTW90_30635 [Neorhizobium sp. P12A]|nr:hypothetical protein DTW90_30635 [Neorhizobium sp. P12A]
MWVKFLQEFCWVATPATNIVFKPDGGPLKDGRHSVTRRCAEAAGDKAVPCARPAELKPTPIGRR